MQALVYTVQPVRWMACKVVGWLTPKVFWSALGTLKLQQVDVPALPGPGWVRLRTILGGICGTDLAAIMQRGHPASILQAFTSLPALLGHENVAMVDQVGAEVTGWKTGDRVVVEPTLSCVPRGVQRLCRHCEEGRFTLCENYRTGPLPVGSMIGWNSFTGGSWGPYFVAHASQLHRVPDSIDDQTAVLVDPLAGALHAVLKRTPGQDETVVVLGDGLIGIGVVACIRALGVRCRLLAVGRQPRRREVMQRFGADEVILVGRRESQAVRYGKVAGCVGGTVIPTKFGHQALVGGADLVYDCVGTGQSLTDAMKYAHAGGTVIEVGTSQICLVDTAPLWFDELTVIGANGRAIERYQGRSMHTYEVVFELLREGRLDLSGLLTHRFRLSQYRDAFDTLVAAGRTGAIKVAFEHPSAVQAGGGHG